MFDKLWKILAGLAVVGLIAGLVGYFMSDRERQMTKLMQQLAVEVQKDFKKQLPIVREIDKMMVLVVGRSPRDEEAQFREQLIQIIIDSDKYNLITWDTVEDKLGESELTKWAAKFGVLPGSQPVTIQQAVDAMKKLDRANFVIDGVLFVEVTQFYEGDATADGFGSKIGVKGTIWSRKKGAEVASIGPVQAAIDSKLDLRFLSHAMSNQSVFWRFPLWLVVACGLPWGLIGLVRAVVKRRKNELNMAMLGVFTLFDVALGWVLLMSFGTGGLALFGLVLVAAMMGYYNYDACDYIERRLL